MTVFPTAGHLASWAGLSPGNNVTGGKRGSGKTNKGQPLVGRDPQPVRLGGIAYAQQILVGAVLATRPVHR